MEVEIKDFRIGNLIECFGIREIIAIKKEKIRVQHEASEGHFIIEWVPINSLELKPILLDEEILLKYGFFKLEPIKENHRRTLTQFCLNKEDFIIEKVYDGFNLYSLRGYFVNLNKNTSTISSIQPHGALKYLHQLQNLYFALTGKELEVTL